MEQQKTETVILPVGVLGAIAEYLMRRPYGEVAGMMLGLQMAKRPETEAEAGEAPEESPGG